MTQLKKPDKTAISNEQSCDTKGDVTVFWTGIDVSEKPATSTSYGHEKCLKTEEAGTSETLPSAENMPNHTSEDINL
jgi:hypothetical protein